MDENSNIDSRNYEETVRICCDTIKSSTDTINNIVALIDKEREEDAEEHKRNFKFKVILLICITFMVCSFIIGISLAPPNNYTNTNTNTTTIEKDGVEYVPEN